MFEREWLTSRLHRHHWTCCWDSALCAVPQVALSIVEFWRALAAAFSQTFIKLALLVELTTTTWRARLWLTCSSWQIGSYFHDQFFCQKKFKFGRISKKRFIESKFLNFGIKNTKKNISIFYISKIIFHIGLPPHYKKSPCAGDIIILASYLVRVTQPDFGRRSTTDSWWQALRWNFERKDTTLIFRKSILIKVNYFTATCCDANSAKHALPFSRRRFK